MKTTTTLTPCRACGREISVNAASCPHCGEPVKPPEKPKQEQTATGLLAAIIIALIVGGALYMMITGGR